MLERCAHTSKCIHRSKSSCGLGSNNIRCEDTIAAFVKIGSDCENFVVLFCPFPYRLN